MTREVLLGFGLFLRGRGRRPDPQGLRRDPGSPADGQGETISKEVVEVPGLVVGFRRTNGTGI